MSADVDPDTGEIVRSESGIRFPDEIRLPWQPMGEVEAREVTRRINTYGIRMCQEIVRAHDGQAHKALGCDTWADYCEKHLGVSRQRAGQLIEHARKMGALAAVVDVDVSTLTIPEGRTRGMDLDEAIALLSDAVRKMPADAPIATRGDLVDAVTKQLKSAAKTAELAPPAEREATTVAPAGPAEDPSEAGPAPSTDEGTEDEDGSNTDATSNLGAEPSPDASSAPGDSGDGESAPAPVAASVPSAEAVSAADDPDDTAEASVASAVSTPPTSDGPGTVPPPAVPGPSDLLILAYAALDADWAYYSGGVVIDGPSFWLPLIAHLEAVLA